MTVSSFFEEVNPSRSSGKQEKAQGQICPPWVSKGPKSAGLNRVKEKSANLFRKFVFLKELKMMFLYKVRLKNKDGQKRPFDRP